MPINAGNQDKACGSRPSRFHGFYEKAIMLDRFCCQRIAKTLARKL